MILSNNVRKVLKKNQNSPDEDNLRIYKLQAHTWHSAFLRKQHCCLPSTSGTDYRERHLQCYFYAARLVHLSEEQIGLLASPPTQALHLCIRASCLGCNNLKADFQGLLASRFIVLLAATPGTQCQVLRYLGLGFSGQQSDFEIMISWFECNLWYSCVSFNRTAQNACFAFPVSTYISLFRPNNLEKKTWKTT